MNTIIKFLIFVIILHRIHCTSDVKDCGATSGKVTAITVSGCSPTSSTCVFKVGTNVSIDVNFQSEINSNTANVKVWGIIGGVPIPFRLQPSDACGNWNIKCPIVNGSANDLRISMPILSQYPKIHVGVRVALLDSNGNKMVCQQFSAQIEEQN